MNQDALIKNAVFILLCNTDKDFSEWGMPKSLDSRTLDSKKLEVDVQCTINGLEVDLVQLIREVNSSFENRVKEAAQEIVQTKLVQLMDSLSNIQQSIDNTEKELRLSSIYFDE